jgi:hypothetical protein
MLTLFDREEFKQGAYWFRFVKMSGDYVLYMARHEHETKWEGPYRCHRDQWFKEGGQC